MVQTVVYCVLNSKEHVSRTYLIVCYYELQHYALKWIVAGSLWMIRHLPKYHYYQTAAKPRTLNWNPLSCWFVWILSRLTIFFPSLFFCWSFLVSPSYAYVSPFFHLFKREGNIRTLLQLTPVNYFWFRYTVLEHYRGIFIELVLVIELPPVLRQK